MLSMRLLWLSALVMCLQSVGCNPEPARDAPRPFEGREFRATIRRDVLHNSHVPTPGVTLYDFHVGSLPLLLVYVGDQAGYPHFGWAADREGKHTLRSGLKGHCRVAQRPEGRARECLIALSETSPKQLMIFYEKLSPEWADVADAIIESIEPK